jgi:NitT/TauT family transport system substrate-binding protein
MNFVPSRIRQISRRRVLKHSVLGVAGLRFSARASFVWAADALKPVSLTLDWVYQGPNVGFILAQDKGFYREAGLDVTMTPGKGSVSTAQLVASKATQIGFSDG